MTDQGTTPSARRKMLPIALLTIAVVGLVFGALLIVFPAHTGGANVGKVFRLDDGSTETIKGTRVSITLTSSEMALMDANTLGLCPGSSLVADVEFLGSKFQVRHAPCGDNEVPTPVWFPYVIRAESIFSDHVLFRIYRKGNEEGQALMECQDVYPKPVSDWEKEIRAACFEKLEERFGKEFDDPVADQPLSLPKYGCEGKSGEAGGDCWYNLAQQEGNASHCANIEPGHVWEELCWYRVAGKTGDKEACEAIAYPGWRHLCENSCNPDIGCEDEGLVCNWDHGGQFHACVPFCEPETGCEREDMECRLNTTLDRNVCVLKNRY